MGGGISRGARELAQTPRLSKKKKLKVKEKRDFRVYLAYMWRFHNQVHNSKTKSLFLILQSLSIKWNLEMK